MEAIDSTIVWDYMEESYSNKTSIVVHQGGTRSGKTYNILIWILVNCFNQWENKLIDIGRKTFPSLRFSVMSDFLEILNSWGMYDPKYHNKSENTYYINSNTIRFFSVDQAQKIRGSKRNILFLNEANEFSHEDFKQLNQRTTEMTILDYNPSDEFHWIYDDVLTRKDADFYKTTFRDNPFLDNRIRKEIFSYKDKDPNYWRVYGLGEKGASEATIFTHWNEIEEYLGEGQESFGMDFGFNDPTTLVRTKYHKRGIVSECLLHKTGLTSDGIIREMKLLVEKEKLKYTDTIYADSARPEIIEDIKRAGFNIHPAKKEGGSILRGINFIKRHKVDVVGTMIEYVKEMRMYKWKVDKDGKILDVPVDVNNHCIDAFRYSLDPFSGCVEEFKMGRTLDVPF